MRNFPLFSLFSVALCVLGTSCAFPDYIATPEGQEALATTATGAARLVQNPADLIAWYDVIFYGAMLALGCAGVIKGSKVAGGGLSKAGAIIKRTVINPRVPDAQ